jgi:hypothetical protein
VSLAEKQHANLLVSSAEEQDAIEMSERKKIIYNIYR